MIPEISLELLQSLILRGLEEQAVIRCDIADVRTLVLGLVDKSQRLERRFSDFDRHFAEFRDDVELMIKAELMGRLGNHEIRVDARLTALEDRLSTPPRST